MAAVKAPAKRAQRLILYGVDWKDYTRLLRAFGNRPAVRLTYDQGELEIMTLSHEHESYGRFLGRLAVTLTEELGLPIKEGGSTTFRRRRQERGLEPDNCYWIASEPLVRGKLKIDLRIDPPPDLAIEVDVTHSSLDRLQIYAALGIPEVWRFDGKNLEFLALGEKERYDSVKRSRAFPILAPTDGQRFLAMRERMDENAVVRQFRSWVREHRDS